MERSDYNDTSHGMLAAIAEQARLKSLKRHGATGEPPDLTPAEATRRGICMGCGGTYPRLYKHVVACPHLEGIKSWSDYARKFQLPDGVAAIADSERSKQSDAAKQSFAGADGEDRRKALADANTGKTRVLYYPIIRLVTSGKSQVEAAKLLGLETRAAQHRCDRADLIFGTPFVCDYGEPFRHRKIIEIRKASGFTADAFEKQVGLASKRSAATRDPDAIVEPRVAIRVFQWRDRVVSDLLNKQTKAYRKDAVLKTLVPELREATRFLLRTVPEIRRRLRKNESWNVEALGEFVHAETQRDRTPDWKRTRNYLWQAEEWFARNLERLRSDEEDGPLIRELLGSRYGATQRTIQNAIRNRTAALAPQEMLRNILLSAGSVPATGSEEVRAKKPAIRKPKANLIPSMIREEVVTTLNRFKQGHLISVTAKRESPSSQVPKLRDAGFSPVEIDAILPSRNPMAAAIRCAARRHKIELKTAKNYCVGLNSSKS